MLDLKQKIIFFKTNVFSKKLNQYIYTQTKLFNLCY